MAGGDAVSGWRSASFPGTGGWCFFLPCGQPRPGERPLPTHHQKPHVFLTNNKVCSGARVRFSIQVWSSKHTWGEVFKCYSKSCSSIQKKKKKAVTHVVTPRAEKSHTPAGFLAGERHERALVDFGCSSCWSLCTGILSSPPPRPPAG